MLKKHKKNLASTAQTKRVFLVLSSALFFSVFSFSAWQQLSPTLPGDSLADRSASPSSSPSSEYGYFNTSPAGESGGFAIPASCPSDIHDRPDYGQPCTSALNNCGEFNTGSVTCAGVCTAIRPADKANCCVATFGNACSTCNSCGNECSAGTIACDGNCNAVAPGLTEKDRDNHSCSDWNIEPDECYAGTTDVVQFCSVRWRVWEYQNNTCVPVACPGGGCVPNWGDNCISPANACGQTRIGTIQCGGSCSRAAPPMPAGFGNACSTNNACGASNPGTINCSGSCSAAAPALPWNLGNSCNSAANSCGWSNAGTIQCDGSCDASTPAEPGAGCPCATTGTACTSAANACGETNAGTINASCQCSAAIPGLPGGYGNACTSSNACGVSGAGGNIDCSGLCTAPAPPNPIWPITCTGCHWRWRNACTGPANFCGQTDSGSYDCEGNCSVQSAPPMPAGYGTSCTMTNACAQSNTGTINCSGSCSVNAPPNPPGYGNPCQSAPNICGMRNNANINCQSLCPAVKPADVLCARHYICPSGVTFGFASPTPYAQLRSYYKAVPFTCADLTGTTETTQAVNWSSSSPGIATVDNGAAKGQVERIAIGTTWISVTPYVVNAPPVPVDVLCVPFINCNSAGPAAILANTCPDMIRSFGDGCGGIVWCTGTRTCDFNWKEVSQ